LGNQLRALLGISCEQRPLLNVGDEFLEKRFIVFLKELGIETTPDHIEARSPFSQCGFGWEILPG
jgi:hypothetical protein